MSAGFGELARKTKAAAMAKVTMTRAPRSRFDGDDRFFGRFTRARER